MSMRPHAETKASTIELLRRAATAAGFSLDHRLNEIRMKEGIADIGFAIVDDEGDLVHTCWNPLRDSGAALDLAVKLKLRVGFRPCAYADTPTGLRFFGAHDGDDAYSRTRLAIVRAAAEMAHHANPEG